MVLLGAIGFVLSYRRRHRTKKLAEETAVMAALFACCMGLIGGLLEMAVCAGWTVLPHA